MRLSLHVKGVDLQLLNVFVQKILIVTFEVLIFFEDEDEVF